MDGPVAGPAPMDAPVASFTIEIPARGLRFACRADQTILAAMIAAGGRALGVGCRGGGCGVCRAHVLRGPVAMGPVSRSALSLEDERTGMILACRAMPRGDVVLAPRPPVRACKAAA